MKTVAVMKGAEVDGGAMNHCVPDPQAATAAILASASSKGRKVSKQYLKSAPFW